MNFLKFTLIIGLISVSYSIFAQQNCSQALDFHRERVQKPWEFSDMSKSATCATGNTYEFNMPLLKGKEYRIMFYAAAVFNNRMRFKIIDQSTHEVIMDLPGETTMNEKGTIVLKDYYDGVLEKMIHPYFDFIPGSSTNFRIIIDVLPLEGQKKSDAGFKAPEEKDKGCVTIIVLDANVEG